MEVKLDVTKEAQTQVRELIKGQAPGTAVRVFVQAGGGGGGCCGGGSEGGGCGCGSASSGPSYGMAFDRPRNGDLVIPVDGFSVVLDPGSADQLDGAKIDFVQSLEATGFTIVPANAPTPTAPIGSGCGCGDSAGGCC